MSNPSKHAIKNYLRNAFKQRLNGKKSPFIIGLIFLIILGISSIYDSSQYLDTDRHTQTALIKEDIYQCTIAKISDGDSITALCPVAAGKADGNTAHVVKASIRIWGIDAPETKQAHWGQDSKEALTKLLPRGKNDTIEVKIKDKDQYNRYVSQLFFNKIDIGLEMVKSGQAVVYRQYNKDPIYIKAQSDAQAAKIGIWKTPGNQQDPANWRKVNPR